MRIEEIFEQQEELPDKVIQAFVDLGEQQRGRPERAMLKVQKTAGGGLLLGLVEHTGDLIHRMTHQMKFGSDKDGFPEVSEKVDKIQKRLRIDGGFENEFIRNLTSNAEFEEKDPDEFIDEIKRLLENYANEHRKLPTYNRAQWLANQAAISVGEQEWVIALRRIREIESILRKGEEAWNEAATEFELDSSGNLKEFPF